MPITKIDELSLDTLSDNISFIIDSIEYLNIHVSKYNSSLEYKIKNKSRISYRINNVSSLILSLNQDLKDV